MISKNFKMSDLFIMIIFLNQQTTSEKFSLCTVSHQHSTISFSGHLYGKFEVTCHYLFSERARK